VLVFFSLRASAGIAAAAILIAPLSRLFEAGAGLPLWWLTSHADALMAGSLAAFALNFHHDLLERILYTQAARWRLVAFALLAAPVILRRYWPDNSLQIMLGPSVQAFAATFLIMSCAFGPAGWVKTALNLKPLNFLGLISYSLYIWQEPFFIWPSDFGFQRLLTFEWPFNIAGMLIMATASYYCLELPLLSLRKNMRHLIIPWVRAFAPAKGPLVEKISDMVRPPRTT
jgi:peptidoglycan/LPS O-acetylase OafA/YrhL